MLLDGALSEITPAMIERVGEKIRPPENGERPLGAIHNPLLKQLYCVAQRYRQEAVMAMARSERSDLDDHEEKQLEASMRKYKQLYDAAMELFWYETRDELDIWSEVSAGVRRGFTLFAQPEENPFEAIFGARL